MRILFVTNMYPSPERPGYGAFVWQQAEQLRQFGHVVDVVNIRGFRSKLNYLKGALEVLWKTSRVAYDVVHAHYGQSAVPACFRFKAPLVVTLHGSDVLESGLLQSFCSRVISHFVDAVIVVSEEMRKRIPGLVIPCGVDLNVFRPYKRDDARVRLGLPKDKYLILFPFDPARAVKRYDLAKAAVERVTKDGVEALACNLPVVATNVGDVGEIMRGVVGTQICTREVGALAHGLREALNISRSGGFEGRAAMAKYDQASTIEKVIGVYNDVLCTFKTRGVQRRLHRPWEGTRRR